MQQWMRNSWRQVVAFVVFTLGLVLLMDKIVMPIYVRHGKELELPDVRHKNVRKAVDLLEEQGFEVEVIDTVEVSGMPKGVVIEQQPSAGMAVKPGRVVRLIVTGGQKYFAMPNLVGMVYKAATILIDSHKLTLEDVEYVFSSEKPEGVVCEQSVLPGSMVTAGTAVSLKVSKGRPERQYVVPQVVGLSLNEARQALRQAGLKVGIIRWVPNADLNPHTVIDQTPKANKALDNPTAVDLQVTVEP